MKIRRDMKKVLVAFNVFISIFIIVNLIFVYSFFMTKKEYKNNCNERKNLLKRSEFMAYLT